MIKSKLVKLALINAALAVLYVVLVGIFFFYGTKYLASGGKMDTLLAPITMLSLFVLSAAVMGALIFGKPLLLYFDNFKKEAVSLAFYTIGFFSVATFIFLILLFITK